MSSKTTGRRGIHSRPNNGTTNDWITPKWIIDALGPFDLDPCRCYGQTVDCAAKAYTIHDDGLSQPWHGRVWLNPPYGSQLKLWIEKLARHGNGIALVPSRTEVESWFWPYIWEAAHAVFFFRGRLYFNTPSGLTAGNAGHGSVLAAYGIKNCDAIINAERGGFIRGRLIGLKYSTAAYTSLVC